MFRTGLLFSTAMTAVSLLLSGAPTGAYAQTGMHGAVPSNANTRFLCTYGNIKVSASSASGYYSRWQHVAVPVIGHGQTVTSIKVIEAPSAFALYPAFAAGIYSNTPSGFPGNRIAGGTGRIRQACGPVRISIRPTRLKRRTTYWIEESIRLRYSSEIASVFWETDPNTMRKAYAQNHWWRFNSQTSQSSSSTSPWTKQTTGPYFTLK